MKKSLKYNIVVLGLVCCHFGIGQLQAEENVTSNMVNASGGAGTNQTADDIEKAEIIRLSKLARDPRGRVTNEVAQHQWTALVQQRQARFLAELQKAQNPVAVALKMAEDGFVDRRLGIEELAKHWEDPRTEQALASISQKGPHIRAELRTSEGVAFDHLMQVRAKKQLAQIVKGKETEQARADAVIKYLEGRPELVQPYPPTRQNAVLARILFTELAKSKDGRAVHLVIKSGQFRGEYAQQHFQEMLSYAQTLRFEEVTSPLYEALYESGDKAIIPLFEKWLPSAKTKREKDQIESCLRRLRKKAEPKE